MSQPNRLTGLLMLLLLTFAGNTHAHELSGHYSASGSNPGSTSAYKGSATLTRKGDTYRIVWQVGARYTGTGIITGDVLSVAYTDAANKWLGVVSYRILDGGNTLQGVWSRHGGSEMGTELLIRQ